MKKLLLTLAISTLATIAFGQFHDKGYGDYIIGTPISEVPFDFEMDPSEEYVGFGIDDIEIGVSFENGKMLSISTLNEDSRLKGIDQPIINKSLEKLKALLGDKCQQGTYNGQVALYYYPTQEAKGNKKSACLLLFNNNICEEILVTKL